MVFCLRKDIQSSCSKDPSKELRLCACTRASQTVLGCITMEQRSSVGKGLRLGEEWAKSLCRAHERLLQLVLHFLHAPEPFRPLELLASGAVLLHHWTERPG